MAGANNKSLKKAGMTASEIEHVRKGQAVIHSAEATAIKHSATRAAAASDFRGKAAAHFSAQRALHEAAAQRKAALQGERAKRLGVSLGAVSRGMLKARKGPAIPGHVRSALESAAESHAHKLADASLATLAAGRKTFVKGKPVFVPFSDEKRAQLKRLQLDAFTEGQTNHSNRVESALGRAGRGMSEREYRAAVDLYNAAGRRVIERRYG